jgi:acyl dehydratase
MDTKEKGGGVNNLTLSNINDFVGHELGVSSWMTVDQSRINQFADCTGDHQWIHVDVDRAKRESPFRSAVAHGYLTLALIAPLAMEIGVVPTDAAAGFNYGLDKVAFWPRSRRGRECGCASSSSEWNRRKPASSSSKPRTPSRSTAPTSRR